MLVHTDDRRFVRDTSNHAVLTTDKTALQRARTQRAASARALSMQDELVRLREQVNVLLAALTPTS